MRPALRLTLIHASLLTALVLTGCGGENATDSGQPGRARMGAGVTSAQETPPEVFTGVAANYTIVPSGAGYLVTDTTGAQAPRTVAATARLRFADVSMAFDAAGVTGQAYRLYRAAFAREPDIDGLGFWISVLQTGAADLTAVAGGFTDSPEYKALYANASTNREIVARFYRNVLSREGEAGGMDFWTGILDGKKASQAEVLRDFSESPENKAGTAAIIAAGVRYRELNVRYPAAPYPLRAAYQQHDNVAHTDYLTVSGTCSGYAESNYQAPVAATFEGQPAMQRDNVVDALLFKCLVVDSLYRWNFTDYYDSASTTLLGHAQGTGYAVGSGSLPVTATIGARGTIATQTVYTDSSKQTYAGKRVITYALDADDSAANAAILTVTSVRTTAANQTDFTLTNRFRVGTDGAWQPLTSEQVYSNGVRLLFTQNSANAQPAKLTVTDTVVGAGAIAQNNKSLTVNYTGWLYDPTAAGFKGKQFDTSVGRGPFTFTLGKGQVIAGWDQGMQGMRVGGKRTLLIPSNLAYGITGAGSLIKGNAALVFEVELLKVE